MNFHLAQIASLPFHVDALRGRDAQHQGGLGIEVDTNRPVAVRALGRRLLALVARVAESRRNAADTAELAQFSDYELSDIGLTRGDIGRVNDPDFAAEYSSARATSQSLKWL